IVVISCLDDYYAELQKMLTRPIRDRVEKDPRPVILQGRCSRDEVVSLVGRRLRRLFEASGAPYDEDRPTAPLPDAMVAKLVGMRARDVLLHCQDYRERCIEEGKMAAYPSEEVGERKKEDEGGQQRIIELEQAWNDFRSSHEMAVPADEESLAAILARAI